MVALLYTLIFSATFAVSLWAMFVTIAPRLDYMRALLGRESVAALAPAVPIRMRAAPRAVPAPAFRHVSHIAA